MIIRLELTTENAEKSVLQDNLSKKLQEICILRPDVIEFVQKGNFPQKHEVLKDERAY